MPKKRLSAKQYREFAECIEKQKVLTERKLKNGLKKILINLNSRTVKIKKRLAN